MNILEVCPIIRLCRVLGSVRLGCSVNEGPFPKKSGIFPVRWWFSDNTGCELLGVIDCVVSTIFTFSTFYHTWHEVSFGSTFSASVQICNPYRTVTSFARRHCLQNFNCEGVIYICL
jgi:hypothetical protein